MEELEDQTEKLKEMIEEVEEKKEKWTMNVALSTAIIAVLAAICGLFSGHFVNEAMMEQIKSSDQWAYYQAKSIKAEITANSNRLLTALDKPVPEEAKEKQEKYEKDKEKIQEEAKKLGEESEKHMKEHSILSWAVTIFQVAVALSAIAIVTRKKFIWYLSLLAAAAATVISVFGFLGH